MKYRTFILFILISSIFTSAPVSALNDISMSCDNCNADSCTCTVSNCGSGDVLIYTGSGCSGFPMYDKEFSSDGEVTWIPGAEGDYSFKVICVDNGISEGSCNSLAIGEEGASVQQPRSQSQQTATKTSGVTSRSTVKTTSPELSNAISTTTVNNNENGNKISLRNLIQRIKQIFVNIFGLSK